MPLAVRDHGGAGRDLLLLHGIGAHLLSMARLADALTPGFRVVSTDLRWSGQSGTSPAFSWDVLVDDVDAVIDGAGLRDPFVVGHSWGGMVAVHWGVAHPDAAGVVNLDGWGFGSADLYDGMDPAEAARTVAALRQRADGFAAVQRSGDDAWVVDAKALLRQVSRARGLDEEAVDAWVDRMFRRDEGGLWHLRPDPVAYEALRSDARIFDLLERVRCPVLVIPSDVGTATDPVVAARRRGTASRLAALTERVSNLRVTPVPGCDHENLLTSLAPVVAAEIVAFAAVSRG